MSNEIKDWVLVPREPTEAMLCDGFESEPDECFSPAEVWQQFEAMSGCQQAAHRARLCYAAMLAAAPTPPAEAQVVGGGEASELPEYWRKMAANSDTSHDAFNRYGEALECCAADLEAALSAQPRPYIDMHYGGPIPPPQPASAPVGVEGLLQRIDAAIERVTSGKAAMRVPADLTDPDLVLADAGNWIKQHALAQQPATVQDDRFPGGFADAIRYIDNMEEDAGALYQLVLGYENDGSDTGIGMLAAVERKLKQPAAVDEGPTHRLLSSADEIRADDEFLGDDTVTWLPVGKEFLSASMCGKKYNPSFLQPMRRETPFTAAQQEADHD